MPETIETESGSRRSLLGPAWMLLWCVPHESDTYGTDAVAEKTALALAEWVGVDKRRQELDQEPAHDFTSSS